MFRILLQITELFLKQSKTLQVHTSAGYNSAVEGGMTRAAHVRVPASSTVYLVSITEFSAKLPDFPAKLPDFSAKLLTFARIF